MNYPRKNADNYNQLKLIGILDVSASNINHVFNVKYYSQ